MLLIVCCFCWGSVWLEFVDLRYFVVCSADQEVCEVLWVPVIVFEGVWKMVGELEFSDFKGF